MRVTVDELTKHNTKDDCWMAIGGECHLFGSVLLFF